MSAAAAPAVPAGPASTEVLRIDGDLTIYQVIELKQRLFGEPAPLEIDLAGVTEVDTAGLQLLLLAKKTAVAAGRDLRLVRHSPAVIDLFDLLDLADWFGDPIVVDAAASPA